MPATLFAIFATAFVAGALAPAVPVALALLLLLAPLLRPALTSAKRTRLCYLILILTAASAGYTYALLRTPAFNPAEFQKITGIQTFVLEVTGTPQQSDFNQRFRAQSIAELNAFDLTVTAPSGRLFHVGDQLRVTGFVQLDQSHSPPTLALAAKRLERIGVHRSLRRTLALLQDWLWSALVRRIPPTSAELAAGLLYGRPLEDPTLRTAFRNAGLSHLTAVSGYNLTLVASAATHLLTALALPRLAVTGTSLFAIFLFTLFTGAQGSVVRAFLMGALLILVRTSGRIPLARNILLGAALGITLLNPANLVTDLGFQLSFLATVGILYLAPPLNAKLLLIITRIKTRIGLSSTSASAPPTNPLMAALVLIGAETLGAQLAVMPLLWSRFGQVNLLALPINLIVTPFVPFLMFCAFLTLLLLPLPLLPLATALPFLPFAKLIELLGRVPSLSFPPSPLAIIILYLGLAYATYALNQHRLPDFHPPCGQRD